MKVDEKDVVEHRSRPAWVKMGRGLHELDLLPDMANVGSGAVQEGESEAEGRPVDLPLAPGAAVVPPPGCGGTSNSESGWRSWTKFMHYSLTARSDSVWQGVPGPGRKRTLSDSSYVSNVSTTPRKRRRSEADNVCEKVPEQIKLTHPIRHYEVNPKALRNARFNTRNIRVDTDKGLDLGELLELDYLDETLSERNRSIVESRACRSKRHGRGWCKFGDNCVVRREAALPENSSHQEIQNGKKVAEKGPEKKNENQNQGMNEFGRNCITSLDKLCRSKFHEVGKCKCQKIVGGTEVIIGTVGGELEQVSNILSGQIRLKRQEQEKEQSGCLTDRMLGVNNSDPISSSPTDLNTFDANEKQDRLRLINEEEARLVRRLRESEARLKAEVETKKSLNQAMRALLEKMSASDKRQEEEMEGIQLISDQLEYYGKLKQEN